MSLVSRFKDMIGFGKTDGDGAGDRERETAQERTAERFSDRPMRRPMLGLDAVGTPYEPEGIRTPEGKYRRPLLGMTEVRAIPVDSMVRQPDRPLAMPEPVFYLKHGDPADGAESLARVPRTKGLKAVTDMMLELYGKASDSDVMQALGRSDRRDPDVAPPAPGSGRDRWIAERVAIAVDPDRDSMTHRAHSQEHNPPLRASVESDVTRALLDGYEPGGNLGAMAMARRAYMSAKIADFMQEGPRLEQRIHAETEHLSRSTDAEVERRFAMSPISSMKAMPREDVGRREWIDDALRAEHAAACAGMMHGSAISLAAGAERGQIPYDPSAALPRIDWSRLPRQDAENALEATRLDRLPDQGLRSRFRDVPGADRASIPGVGSAERRTWIEVALQAQRIREAMPLRGRDVAEDIGRQDAAKDISPPARQPIREIEFTPPDLGRSQGKRPPPAGMAAHLVRQNGM